MSNNGSAGGARREYERVADHLRRQIEGRELEVGAQLPTHHELTESFRVSRATVQRALKALQEAGYVESAQGRGVFVADWRSGPPVREGGAAEAVSDPSGVELDDVIADAFEAEQITIDAFCLTAESLHAAVMPQVRRIQRGKLSPRSLRVRLIVPRIDGVRLAVPRRVDDPGAADQRPQERLAHLIRLHNSALKNVLEDLRHQTPSLAESVVEIKRVPLTPVFKTYLVNSRWGLTGYYSVIPRQVELLDDEEVEIFDVLGVGATLFPQGAKQMVACQEWFDSLWETIAWDPGDTPRQEHS